MTTRKVVVKPTKVSEGAVSVCHINPEGSAIPTTVDAILAYYEKNGGVCLISRRDMAVASLADASACMDALDKASEEGLIVATSKPDIIEVRALPGARDAFLRFRDEG